MQKKALIKMHSNNIKLTKANQVIQYHLFRYSAIMTRSGRFATE